MGQKTTIVAADGKQELLITREFDLPLKFLFRAFVEPEIVEQWMGTRVLKLDCKKHGGFQFETTDRQGNKYDFNGVIHEVLPDEKIIRTFEMERMPFGVQLDIIEFEKITDSKSRLRQKSIYQSAAHRDENLKLPFEFGINATHDRLQQALKKYTRGI